MKSYLLFHIKTSHYILRYIWIHSFKDDKPYLAVLEICVTRESRQLIKAFLYRRNTMQTTPCVLFPSSSHSMFLKDLCRSLPYAHDI